MIKQQQTQEVGSREGETKLKNITVIIEKLEDERTSKNSSMKWKQLKLIQVYTFNNK